MLIHPAEARRQLVELVAGGLDERNLAHAALLVSLEDNPSVDVPACLAELDELVARVGRRCAAGEPPVFRLGHLHAELFDRDGYRGDAENYYDPRNAYLNQVLERKRGLPITLSIVFLHVATAIGLNAAGVGLPGHYIVKVQFELNEVYVDPFHAGTTLTTGEIGALLSDISGGQLRLASEHLRAWSARETLLRVLANLQSLWTRAGDRRKAAAAAERMALLQE